jgi:2'-deoxynucleoside 5'-phosphate N-hydrolase
MNKLAYISVSYSKRHLLNEELLVITQVLNQFDITAFVFADNYQFDKTQERVMMQQAFDDIDKADILIAETSDKAIGIGVEVGYAKAKGKTIVYVRHLSAPHSTTVAGSSDFQIVFKNAIDLGLQMKNLLTTIEQKNINH